MLTLSDLFVTDHDMDGFKELTELVRSRALQGEMFLNMDIKPPFKDTPDDWQDQLEAAFTSARR